jgi:hypothetical protein
MASRGGHAGTNEPAGAAPAPSAARLAWLLFALLAAVYLANGDFLRGNDAVPNVYLAAEILEHGRLSFTPEEAPFMFIWTVPGDAGPRDVYVGDWNATLDGKPFAAMAKSGALTFAGPKYFLHPTSREGLYAGTFGPGAGLTALPVLALVRLAVGDLFHHTAALWYGTKVVAALTVAGSAALVFLAALAFTSRRRAALVALAYGLGTGVFPTSSQALWQHGPNELCLALGALMLVRGAGEPRRAAVCGLALGWATVCRPTSGIVLGAVALHFAMRERRALGAFALGAAAPLALLAAYNLHFFGSPFAFGQTEEGPTVALAKTGSPEVWVWPLAGAAGILVSPSRGLLVHSPVMLFGLWGAVVAWRDPSPSPLRPLVMAVAVLWLVSFCWFDWWGGWSFGYRPILDTMPLVALMMAPVADALFGRRAGRVAFSVLLAWSIVVQVVGALAYDVAVWNNRPRFEVSVPGEAEPRRTDERAQMREWSALPGATVHAESMDVDLPEYRRRLWSLRDNQVGFYLSHFVEARKAKKRFMARALAEPAM